MNTCMKGPKTGRRIDICPAPNISIDKTIHAYLFIFNFNTHKDYPPLLGILY